ncbi:MAG: transglutaminase-like domain-containing protein [Oscillospiraceae bacterium]|nr:transglutaminase-like domain-containing protein [Oscillospiraceae bacterium]
MLKRKSKKTLKHLEYTPVFVNTHPVSEDKGFSWLLLFRLLVKMLLTFMSAVGLSISLAQIYRIPVSLSAVAVVCLGSVIFFMGALIIFRRRVLIVPLFAFVVGTLFRQEEFFYALSLFNNHMLHVLDSRLLKTGGFASYDWHTLTSTENARAIAVVFLLFCILISILFTLESLSRSMGFMLIFIIFSLLPAFGAEIAGYVFGFELMLAGLIGNYSAWVAHIYNNTFLTPKSAQSNNPPLNKAKRSKFAPKLPHYYKNSRNALATASLTLIAVLIAANAVPNSVHFNYQAIVDMAQTISVDVPMSVRQFFRRHFGEINHGGFFPNFDGVGDISMGIAMDTPPTGSTPILRVTLDDDRNKIFLRGGIGVDLYDGYWSISQDSSEFSRLINLLESGFAPELEYHVFRQTLQMMEHEDDLFEWRERDFREDDWIWFRPSLIVSEQNVKIEYLARTAFLLLPTHPYNTNEIRANRNYDWHLDTVIRPQLRVDSHDFDALYLRLNNREALDNAYWSARNMRYLWVFRHNETGVLFTNDEMNEYINELLGFDFNLHLDTSGWDDEEWDEWFRQSDAASREHSRLMQVLFEDVMVESDQIANFPWNFPCGTTPEEWADGIAEYRELIEAVYKEIPDVELRNIDDFLSQMGFLTDDEIDTLREEWDGWEEEPELWWNDMGSIVHGMGSFPEPNESFPFIVRESPHLPFLNALSKVQTVQKINDYLRANYAWSLEVDNSAGDNTPLGNFLFDTEQGHCALYATAMTLAVRRLGIPARYVTGVVTVTGGGTVQELAERDFHAWVEVYFAGVGWIPFDPTGGARGNDGGRTASNLPDTTPPETTPTTPPTPPSVPEATSPPETAPIETPPPHSNADGSGGGNSITMNLRLILIIVSTALFIVVLLAVLLIFAKRIKKAENDKFTRWQLAFDGDGEDGCYNRTAHEIERFMFRLLKSEGIENNLGETPLQFAKRVDELRLFEDFGVAIESKDSKESSNTLNLSKIMPFFEKLEFADADNQESMLSHEEYSAIYEYVTKLYQKTVVSKKTHERFVKKIVVLQNKSISP